MRQENYAEKKCVSLYPFGLKHKGYNNVTSSNGNSTAQKFKYNGVEYEESLGLNLYEMDVRMYDPAIGRFNGIDPITHFSQGTSVAFDNNPVFFADPSGADSEHDFSKDIWGRDKYDSFSGLYIPPNERGEKTSSDSTDDRNAIAVAKGISGLYIDGEDVSNMSEEEKQERFKNSAIETIGILMWEFATGTGKNKRNFNFEDHPFARQVYAGRIQSEIFSEFSEKLNKDGYNFNELKDSKVYTIALEFSPTIDPRGWMESGLKHIYSNSSQKFIGGAIAKVSIKNTNIEVMIYNATSRKSFLLHIGDNYNRSNTGINKPFNSGFEMNKPLSTIEQYIHATFKNWKL